MTAAVIDLGTNTFHLIIADLADNIVNVIYKTDVPARLGEGRLNENIIIPEAFERGLLTLEAFAKTIQEHKADIVKATATSAVRSASNGMDFVNAAKERTGIDIEVISGDREAEYIFKGVQATGMINDTSLVMDIGGGSTEFILCRPDELIWKKSYDIGAARLMQAYFKSDPLSLSDKRSIIAHFEHTISDLIAICQIHKPQTLIGSAGAFESFATLLMVKEAQDKLSSAPLDVEGYKELAERLITSTHQERVEMEGLIPLRVDMIVIAAVLVNYVMDNTKIENLSLSTFDLKMGVLYSLIS
ncbi:MAG: Ppx/GppA phosphatase [Pedobacter sp.]|nr:Ppx/GppA phosphatase [Pedobacter sp.]